MSGSHMPVISVLCILNPNLVPASSHSLAKSPTPDEPIHLLSPTAGP